MKLASSLLLLAGAAGFLVTAFLPWYDQGGFGPPETIGDMTYTENGWDGEYSLAASIGAAAALLFGAVGLIVDKLPIRLLALAGALAALIFVIVYYQQNSQGFEIGGKFYGSQIRHGTVYAAIAAAAIANVGGVLGLFAKTKAG